MEPDFFILALFITAIIITSSLFIANRPHSLPKGRTALIIAHPDDEVMFFYPTLLHMPKNSVRLLCVTTGNADKLGAKRSQELHASCDAMPSIFLCDVRDAFPDGMDQHWDISECSRLINDFFLKHEITDVLTFDENGISNHPNHCEVYAAVHQALSEYKAPISAYFLRTISFWRKYLGVSAVFFDAMMESSPCTVTNSNPFWTLRALTRHWSQMVWYRWFWCFVSRYSYSNSFDVEHFGVK